MADSHDDRGKSQHNGETPKVSWTFREVGISETSESDMQVITYRYFTILHYFDQGSQGESSADG